MYVQMYPFFPLEQYPCSHGLPPPNHFDRNIRWPVITKYKTYIKQKACTYTCVFICYMRICMDPGFFVRVVAVRAQLIEKSPDNFFNPQLILQWGPNVYFKENIIFPESKQGRGVKNVRGSTFSKVMGPNCFFL